MMKKNYLTPQLKVVRFKVEEVFTSYVQTPQPEAGQYQEDRAFGSSFQYINQ